MDSQHDLSTLGERARTHVLPSGLRVDTMFKPDYQYKSAIMSVDFGSANTILCRNPESGLSGESVRLPPGTAHFLEHRLFERDGEDITDSFAALGAEVNAHTGYTSTDFLVSCVDHLEDCIDLLLSLVLDLELTEDAVPREREIITKEIELYGDSLEWMSYFSVMRTMYPDSVLATDMAGTEASIPGIDSELLRSCHRTWYRPERMSLFLSGEFERVRILEIVSQRLGRHTTEDSPIAATRERWRRRWPGRARETTTLDIARPRLTLGFRDTVDLPVGRPLLQRELAADVALDMLFGPASEFYSTTYENGLIDLESFGCDVYVEPEFGHCMIGGDSDSPPQLEKAIVGNLEKAKSGGLQEGDFTRAKRKALGNLIEQFNDVDACTALMHSAVSRGGELTDFFAAHQSLTLKDVLDCIDTWLDPEHYGVSLVEPRRLDLNPRVSQSSDAIEPVAESGP